MGTPSLALLLAPSSLSLASGAPAGALRGAITLFQYVRRSGGLQLLVILF